MDVTPQVINEVEFHQKMRGYDPDEVDDFLERVAVAVEQLQARIREAEQRAVAAERRVAPGPPSRKAEAPVGAPVAAKVDEAEEAETIRRTLVLAQRTADAAIKEAEDEARRVLQTTQEQVQRLQTEAEERARKVVLDAETDARKSADDTRQRLVKEIIALEETRDALRADQGILERHLDEQRLRLRSSIGELQRLLDDPGRLRVANPPELSSAALPPIDDLDALTAPPETDDAHDALEADDGLDEIDDEAGVIDLDAPSTSVRDDVVDPRPVTGGVTFTPPQAAGGVSEPTAREPGRVALATDDAAAWERFAQGDLDGPPTMPVTTVDRGEDAYLTELRKAMLEDTSAGTLDPGEHRARTRFGRRR
ncbi:MAG TPA: DivIVA domain-containing protein [Acidimicrobiales bacterium]|jgi:DivIVA domain-containing protein|nr:DivIVA domain-containing protein [Acidimicrobiales bacterium]